MHSGKDPLSVVIRTSCWTTGLILIIWPPTFYGVTKLFQIFKLCSVKRQGMLSQSVHRKRFVIQSHMKIRENQNPKKSVDKKAQRTGRGIWWKDKDLDSSSLSFTKLWYFRYVTNLKFSKAISLFSDEVNTNHIIGFERGANKTCFVLFCFLSVR